MGLQPQGHVTLLLFTQRLLNKNLTMCEDQADLQPFLVLPVGVCVISLPLSLVKAQRGCSISLGSHG